MLSFNITQYKDAFNLEGFLKSQIKYRWRCEFSYVVKYLKVSFIRLELYILNQRVQIVELFKKKQRSVINFDKTIYNIYHENFSSFEGTIKGMTVK